MVGVVGSSPIVPTKTSKHRMIPVIMRCFLLRFFNVGHAVPFFHFLPVLFGDKIDKLWKGILKAFCQMPEAKNIRFFLRVSRFFSFRASAS